ncbi:MAG: VanW family protein [Patescibacteria group bacterium]|nr:VanW family protein [Patescibacteria group bacterium]
MAKSKSIKSKTKPKKTANGSYFNHSLKKEAAQKKSKTVSNSRLKVKKVAIVKKNSSVKVKSSSIKKHAIIRSKVAHKKLKVSIKLKEHKPTAIGYAALIKKMKPLRRFLKLAIILIIIVGMAKSATSVIEWYFSDRFFPNIAILNEHIGGNKRQDVSEILRQKITKFIGTPFIFYVGANKYQITPRELGVEIPIADTLRQAYVIGHTGDWSQKLKERFSTLAYGKSIPLAIHIDEARLQSRFELIQELTPPKFSDLIKINSNKSVEPKDNTGRFNQADFNEIEQQIYKAVAELKSASIRIKLIPYEPQITEKEMSSLSNKLSEWSAKKISLIYKLNHKYGTFELDFGGDSSWFMLREAENKNSDAKLSLILNETKIDRFLADQVVPKMNHDRVDAHLSLDENGKIKVTGFAHAKETLNFDAARQLILAALQSNKDKISLPISSEPPKIIVDKAVQKKYGLTELLATGWSDFSYSPSNRINNIKVGLSKFNDLLIAPKETFSFNRNLGYVGSATGFLPELVIKGHSTVPEFGGGLCQVSTTHYRAALLAGLPIIDRHNHIYHVFHYAPGGSDATIYPPSPDLKFMNDTDGYILIQAWTEGTDAYVNLYGQSDGRKVVLNGPWVTKYRRPGPPIIIGTTSLPVGVKKTQEYEVYGFDALWTRQITWSDKREIKEEIKSHYMPWPAVIMVGVSGEEAAAKKEGE